MSLSPSSRSITPPVTFAQAPCPAARLDAITAGKQARMRFRDGLLASALIRRAAEVVADRLAGLLAFSGRVPAGGFATPIPEGSQDG